MSTERRRPWPPRTDYLMAEWRQGDGSDEQTLLWIAQAVTRVEGFEVEDHSGAVLHDVKVGSVSQLAEVIDELPLIALVQHHPADAIAASPLPGWKIGPIAVMTAQPGSTVSVIVRRFRGRMRPYGRVVPR